jgi:hypothetical protein
MLAGPAGELCGRAVQDGSIELGRAPGIGYMPHTGPIWLAVRSAPHGSLGRFGFLPARLVPEGTQGAKGPWSTTYAPERPPEAATTGEPCREITRFYGDCGFNLRDNFRQRRASLLN